MTDISAMLNEFSRDFNVPAGPLGAPAPQPLSLGDKKKADVTAASQAKKDRIAPLSPDAQYGLAAARAGNTGMSVPGEVPQDTRSMDISQLFQKYGEQSGEMIRDQSAADAGFLRDRTSARSEGQAVKDAAVGVGSGLANTGFGIATLAAGAVNDNAGAALADANERFNADVRGAQSPGLNNRRQANAALDQMDSIDNEAKFAEEIAANPTGSNIVAEISRFGRGAVNTVARQIDDGVLLADGTANAVGSLVGSGMLMKGLAKIGTAVMGRATAAGASAATADKLNKAGNFLNAPIAVGGMEAGGAYQQTMTEAMAALEGRDDLTQDEKLQMASDAAMRAAGVQGAVGAVTGKLVGSFERAPLRSGGIADFGRNIGKETIEESTQSATAQIAMNEALSQEIDPGRDAGVGAGEQAGVGGLYGLGSTVMAQGPATAVRAPVDAAVYVGTKAYEGLKRKGNDIIEGVKASSPISGQSIDKARSALYETLGAAKDATSAFFDRAKVLAPEAVGAAREIVSQTAGKLNLSLGQAIESSTVLSPEQKTAGTDFISRLTDSLSFDPLTVENDNTELKEFLSNSRDKIEAVTQAAKLAADEARSPEGRVAAGKYLVETFNKIQAFGSEEISDAVVAAVQNSGAAAGLTKVEETLRGFAQDPRIRGAMEAAMNLIKPITPEEIQDAQSTEAQQAIQDAVTTSQAAMLDGVDAATLAKVNPDTVDKIVEHHDNGEIELTPNQRTSLIVSSALARGEKQQIEEAKAAGITSPKRVGIVSRQVQNDRNDGTDKLSVTQHMVGVMNAMWGNNTKEASERLSDLMNFAQSMKNKVDALNQSKAEGGIPIVYQAWNQTQKTFYDAVKTPVTYKDHTDNAREFLNSTAIDARAVAMMANNMAEKFPELGVKPIDMPVLNKIKSAPVKAVPKPNGVVAPVVAPVVKPTAAEKITAVVEAAPRPERTADEFVQPKAEKAEKVEAKVEAPAAEPAVVPVVEAVVEPVAKTETKVVVEDVEDDTDVVEPGEATGLEAEYPQLMSAGKVKNLFHRAFSRPQQEIARLSGLGNVAKIVRDAMTDQGSFVAFSGDTVNAKKLTAEVAAEYRRLLGNRMFGEIQRSMDAALQKGLATITKGKTLGEFLDTDGNQAMNYARNRSLSIVEKGETGFAYNRELQQSAILAGLQWAITADGMRPKLDTEKVAKMLGVSETAVSPGLVTWMNASVYQTGAVQDLASKIVKYWGVSSNNNAPSGWTIGVPGGVAGDVMEAMVEAGLAEVVIYVWPDWGQMTKAQQDALPILTQIRLFPSDGARSLLEGLSKFPDAIEAAVMVTPEQMNYVGAPPKNEMKTQLRNKFGKLQKQQFRTRDRAEKTEYKLHVPAVDMMMALGVDAVTELFGHGRPNEKTTNVRDYAAMKSVNKTLFGAFEYMKSLKAETEAYAEASDMAVGDAPIFYKYAFTKVQRLMMLGAYNPQANKFIRELVLPTNSTLDLSDQGSDATGMFWLSIAQAWGEKVHKQSRSDSEAAARTMAEKKYANTLSILENWLGERTDTYARTLTAGEIKTIRSEMAPKGGPIPSVAFNAAMELARFNIADEAGKKAFTTPLYVEADGVTDGPINALVNLASGGFSQDWLNLVAKGGLFYDRMPDGSGMTMNQHMKGNTKDLYEVAKDALHQFLNGSKKAVVGSKDEAMRTMMDLLLPGFGVDPETGALVIDRKVTKNPLTVTIYGSGEAGLGNKIVSEMDKELSKLLTKLAQSKNPEGEFRSADEYKSFISLLGMMKGKAFDGDFVNYELTGYNKDQLARRLKEDFVQPLVAGIDATIGETVFTRDLIRKSIQVHSIYMKARFIAERDRLLAEKAATAKETGWLRSDFLSQNELNGIYKRLNLLAPVISTGTQDFYLGSKDNANMLGKNDYVSKSIGGTMSMPASFYAPANAGVSGIPGIVIGSGDGQMVQNIYGGDQAPENTMPVYDGVHVKLTTAQADGVLINKAVYDAWMLNPVAAVQQSYAEFFSSADLSVLSAEQMKDLQDAVFGFAPKGHTETLSETMAELDKLNGDLLFASRSSEARKYAMSKVSMSVDHMASLEAPFVSPGIDASDMSMDEVTSLLDSLYDEKMKELNGTPATSQNISDDLKAIGSIDGDTNARVISTKELASIAQALNIPAKQKQLLIPLLKSLSQSGHKVVFGDAEAVSKMAIKLGTAMPVSENGRTKGFFSTSSKTMFLIQPSSETLVHELIHAATYASVDAYYSNPQSLSQNQRDAVSNIDTLMKEWLAAPEAAELLNIRGQRAFLSARNAVLKYIDTDRAASVNEFMAWVLSNEDLSRAAARTEVQGKLAKIIDGVLKALKRLLGVGTDVYSNLRFNTEILLRSNTMGNAKADVVLAQNQVFGRDDRLTALRQGFYDRIMGSVAAMPDVAKKLQQPQRQDLATLKAEVVSASFIAHGFPMTAEAKGTFEVMLAAFMTETELDPAAMIRLEDIYRHVMGQLKADNFRTNPGVSDPADEYLANEKYNSLVGNFVTEYDETGRSSLLPAFMALANVDDGFRNILSKLKLPKTDKVDGKTLDAVLTNAATSMMDNVAKILSNEGKQANVLGAVDRLTDQVARIGEWEKSRVDMADELLAPVGRASDSMNALLVKGMQTGSRKLIDKIESIQANTNNKYVKMGTDFVRVMASIVNIDEADVVGQGLTKAINNIDGFKSFREIMAEFIGRTDANGSVYDMIKTVRATIKSLRQQFREKLPKIIASKFSRKVTADEWSDMFVGLGQTDLAVLKGVFTIDQIHEMIAKPAELSKTVRALEKKIAAAYGQDWSTIERKSLELAKFMNERVVAENLLRNAHAISLLWGERKNNGNPKPTAATVTDIDHLVSLYAYQGLPQNTRDSLAKLVTDEAVGTNFVLSYLVGQRSEELLKATRGMAQANHFKGYIPSPANEGRTLIVANLSDDTMLLTKGFTRVAEYMPSAAERFPSKRAYYFAPLAPRSAFNEGIVQTVRATASGVDPSTGFSSDYMTAGRITNPLVVRKIIALQARGLTGGQALMPIYQDGKVIAFERSIDPLQELRLERKTNLANTLGIWRGRQMEEGMGTEMNQMLLTKLLDAWTQAKRDGRQSQFINVMDENELKKDAVLADAVKLIPPDMRLDMAEMFGEDQLWIQKDMVNNTLGYRAPSIGDAWTGTTRWGAETQKNIQGLVTGVFGKDAYKHVVRIEKGIQNVVSDAKVTIVVKSMIVPAANLIANAYQLMARGVPVAQIFGGIPKKVAEIDFYVKNRVRKIDLEAELRAATGDVIRTRTLTNQIQSIDDSFKRLSIAPLLEAGEFAAISDVGIGQEEIDLVEGRLSTYVDNLVAKLPESVRTAGRYAVVGKDTALFQGLQRAMEYGDFLGKAILFDDMTKRQGKSASDTLKMITEEYGNFDYLPGRTRSYGDSLGLMWFWAFKIRSTKVALSMIRNNPFHSLMSMITPSPDFFGDVGNPISDNIVSVGLDGRLDQSMGWGMGFRAHQLNPWVNILE